MLTGSTLVVVADGAVARFLSRARPEARLVELIDKRMDIAEIELERDRPARISDRFGSGRHKIEKRLTAHEAAEKAFLARVADRAATIGREASVEHLVLCAPPRALGSLRRLLPPAVNERLALSLSKDVTKETPAEVDERLRELRV